MKSMAKKKEFTQGYIAFVVAIIQNYGVSAEVRNAFLAGVGPSHIRILYRGCMYCFVL